MNIRVFIEYILLHKAFRQIFGVVTAARGGGRGAPQAGGEEGGAVCGRRWEGAPQAGGCEKRRPAGIGRDKHVMYGFISSGVVKMLTQLVR